MHGTNGTKDFIAQLRLRTQQKAEEYAELLHEQNRIQMLLERTKAYVEKLNSFLEAEGQVPVALKAARPGNLVGKPGNRSKELPLRKAQWEGMTINQIVQRILNTSPSQVYHPRGVAPLIYEIQSDLDLRMVIPKVRSTLQKGAREGLWDRVGRANFRAKVTVEQGRLVHA